MSAATANCFWRQSFFGSKVEWNPPTCTYGLSSPWTTIIFYPVSLSLFLCVCVSVSSLSLSPLLCSSLVSTILAFVSDESFKTGKGMCFT